VTPDTSSTRLDEHYAFPLSFAQERLWILDQLAPGTPLYNLSYAIRVRRTVDPGALQAAVNGVVERHEVLRTVFRVVDGEPKQVVLPSVRVPLLAYDLRRVPSDRREAEASRIAAEIAAEPYQLSEGPLLRTMLIWLAPGDYVLVVGFHHVVADGWSMGVFERELGLLYEGVVGGRGVVLAPLVVQYADFAVWQRELLVGERLVGALGFWRELLGGMVPLALPTDRPRPGVQLHRGAGFGFVVDGGVVEGLGRVSRESGATLFMVLLAGFVVVLGRWCGQDDVVVGAPIAGRDRAELEGLIGFFVNTLVLRVDVSGDPSFVELVGRVREVALGAYGHAEVPFEKLVEELAPERDLSRNPLFQVTFQLFESPSVSGVSGVGSGLEIPVTSSLFDVRVDVWPLAAGGLGGRVEFDTDLFDRVSMEWLVERFVWVLEQVAVDGRRRVGSLSLVPAGQAGLVAGWNATGVVGGEVACVHRVVEARVGEAGGRVAVGDGDGVWSFGELNGFANRLAWRLLELGVGRGEVVAVWLPRGRRFVAAVLGVLKAGGVYLPLDPVYPVGRVAQVVADAVPVVVVTVGAWASVEVPAGTTVVTVDAWPEGREDDPAVGVGVDDAAYVIYTSGSTGTPKGVVVEHRSLANLVGWHNRVYGVDREARGSQIASVGFDAAVWEIWPYLCAGASVWVVDDDTRNDADGLIAWLADREITTAFIPTPLAEMVLDRPWPAHARLSHLLTGGDTLHRWANPDHPYTLINHYGPTEHTVVATATVVPAAAHPDRLPDIGAPIDNTVCYVVDHTGNQAGPGVPGELWIGGVGCARGYHNDPALTAERFVPNPFASTPPRLYRTGDHVRWTADGTLAFLGRLDHQIKIRGYRIEPRELETLLTHHPHITNAIITTHPHPTTNTPQLTAYITTTKTVAERDRLDQVAAWRTIYDTTYADGSDAADLDPEFDIRGWNSSYDGTQLGATVMAEQVDQTVDRIRALEPASILEIGAGSGLLLYRLAGTCQRYVATDFSRPVLDRLRARVASREWHHVQLLQRDADDLTAVAADDDGFDVVVLNSVVQYFPDETYLERVLEGAATMVRPGGAIFVGDVRNHALLEAFHTSVELARASDDVTIDELRHRIRVRMAAEQELLVDPAWFDRFAATNGRVTHVAARPRRGHTDTELTRFRYDVVLTVDGRRPMVTPRSCLEWEADSLTLTDLGELVKSATVPFAVRGVPSARLTRIAATVAALADADDDASVEQLRTVIPRHDGIDPEALWDLGTEDVEVDLAWHESGGTGRYDVIVRPADSPMVVLDEAARAGGALVNDPASRRHRLASEIKDWMRAHVPEQMVPSTIMTVATIPLTSHGKVDLDALPAPDPSDAVGVSDETDVAASAMEERLVQLWAETLGVPGISRHDNFFAVGGDSILSIKLVSRAAEAGLHFTAKDLFQNQTIAELATVVSATRRVEAEQGAVVGEVLLTPVQRWFFEQHYAEPHHFNQTVLLPVARTVDLRLFARALRAVIAHHDALRFRFEHHNGEWRQFAGDAASELQIASADLSRLPPATALSALERACAELQAGLSFTDGPLVRVGLFDLGPRQPWRALIAIHHLAVDAVSWRILLEDLWASYAQLAGGLPIRLPLKTTSFQRWAHQLAEHASTAAITDQADFWIDQLVPAGPALPRDRSGHDNTVGGARTVRVALSRAETDALLHRFLAERSVEINEVLVTALAVTIRAWTGEDVVTLVLEGHGREPLFDDVDLSRTIGWFTSIFPVRLLIDDAAPLAALTAVADQLRRIPDRGIGFGILRYLSPDAERRAALAAASWPELVLNYLGQLDATGGAGDPLRERRGPDRGPVASRSYLIEVNAAVVDGCFQADVYYAPAIHDDATARTLAEGFVSTLGELVSASSISGAGPTYASERVSHQDVDALLAELRRGRGDP
jgi:amino acid adenylation domain-containing protein/non-ribosomal peptide synthase protein (TIGR01720 family)